MNVNVWGQCDVHTQGVVSGVLIFVSASCDLIVSTVELYCYMGWEPYMISQRDRY